MTPFDGVALSALAVVLFAASWLAWTGRWRDWARHAHGPDLPLYVLPTMGMAMMLAVLAEWVRLPVIFWVVAVAVLFAGFVLGMMGAFWRLPRWAVPGWLRPYYRKFPPWGPGPFPVRDRPAVDGGGTSQGEVRIAQAFAPHLPRARWKAWQIPWPKENAVADPSWAFGYVVPKGWLVVYEPGLGFFVDADDEVLGAGELSGAVYPAERLTAVTTVAADAGPAGSPGAGKVEVPGSWWLGGRWRRRLVIEAGDRIVMFALARARKRADLLAAQYGIERRPDA